MYKSLKQFSEICDTASPEEIQKIISQFVEKITFTPTEIKIALFDQPIDRGQLLVNHPANGAPNGSEWLPIVSSGANFSYTFEYQKDTKISKRKIKRQKRLEAYVNPILKAKEYQQMLKDQGLNQSKLAKKLGISRVRVHQILSILKLPKEQQDYILHHGKEQMITERSLRNDIGMQLAIRCGLKDYAN